MSQGRASAAHEAGIRGVREYVLLHEALDLEEILVVDKPGKRTPAVGCIVPRK
jgi:hypothetical protein